MAGSTHRLWLFWTCSLIESFTIFPIYWYRYIEREREQSKKPSTTGELEFQLLLATNKTSNRRQKKKKREIMESIKYHGKEFLYLVCFVFSPIESET